MLFFIAVKRPTVLYDGNFSMLFNWFFKKMTNVYLIRHGQASAGTSNYDRLSKIGIEQARLLGVYWKQSGFHVDAAFNGSLQRQQHTAELALAGIEHTRPIETLEALNEYDHHAVDKHYGEGVVSDGGTDLQFSQYVEIMARWRDSQANDELQSWGSFSMQAWHAIQAAVNAHTEIKKHRSEKHANLAFFTSGGVIATVLQQLLSLEFTSTLQAVWHTRNASVTTLLFNKDGISLVDYNTVPHLQIQHDKSLITQI